MIEVFEAFGWTLLLGGLAVEYCLSLHWIENGNHCI